jgi:hypothetical protein
MGLRPTHRDESPVLAPTDSKWVICDFRRIVIRIYRKLTEDGSFRVADNCEDDSDKPVF